MHARKDPQKPGPITGTGINGTLMMNNGRLYTNG